MLFHQVQTQSCAPRGNDESQITIYQVQSGHNHEAGDTSDGGGEHQGRTNGFEHEFAAREFDLCHCVCSKGREEQVTRSSYDGDKYRVEYVSRERNPRVTHKSNKVLEVIESRSDNVESRREHKQLVKRLQRLNNDVVHRYEHKQSENGEHKGYACVAACRAVKDYAVASCS